MKIVIHIGMPKTGTSSIQKAFSRLDHPDIVYADWEGRADPALFGLLFESDDKLPELPLFKARGPEFLGQLPKLRDEAREKLTTQLSRSGDKTVVFSSEVISMPAFADASRRMRDFFSEWSDNILVIGYARHVTSYAVSTFQQQLKGGHVPDRSLRGVAPHYRTRFEQMDSIFGRERVLLKEFSRERLLDGDVLQDFAAEIGLPLLSPDQIVRINEGLSLEAVALLYVQRHLGRGFVSGFPAAFRANTRFISRLATIGTRKFAFSPQMMAPILEMQRDDIAWMEARLGHPFSDSGTDHKDAIDSLDDLVDIALGQFDAVQELLGEDAVDGPATTESLVQALERLREQCYAQVLHTNAGHAATGEARPLTETGISTMATKTDRLEPTEEDLRLRRILARLLWNSDHKDDMPSDPAERKAAFDLVRRDYQKKALDLTRRLANNNLKLVETDKQS